MEKLRDVTLIFLVKKEQNQIQDILLAMKKRGFGVNRWNGVGGKLEEGESIEEAAIREAQEEVSVQVLDLLKVAEIDFHFPHNPKFNQKVHAYLCEKWEGEPQESEEMRPQWFKPENIPYPEMWPDDEFWLPQVLQGQKLRAKFIFGENDSVQEQAVNLVDNF
ncbi:MAG TPA: 8-oxo-dGTP diphosphatase [Candidatus Gracilibacteria bacterium]|nr:8-oxo-dGTP diphosphatase [Candidatus Gracilibacteria bacterium]